MERNRSPFPGMDPYLEHPAHWRGVHSALVTYLCEDLQAVLPARYYAAIEDRVYVDTLEYGRAPDVRVVDREGSRAGGGVATAGADAATIVELPLDEVEEHYIEIRDAKSGHRIATVIEVLSPSNKKEEGEGVTSYRRKQAEVLGSDANLVEVDLLRAGKHIVAVPERLLVWPYEYLVVVRRTTHPSRRELYPVPLRARLPRIAVPLCPPDADVVVDVQGLVARVYESGAYAKRIDYAAAPIPALSAEDGAWVRQLLVGTGPRTPATGAE